ncbi:polysaccharide biosynthesis tyrosine autokinase [Acidipropionibacterium jensenii]|uniref:polysaccharide biosynthesis tyrosine autokinase n=1 Tax=Acidipropionibacterium jensenii TaxID=1749 RepID=UPI00068634F7|nr:polysaccharide biosynthesis tyrosine autokinase [Acidipropionibacterium jensenii]
MIVAVISAMVVGIAHFATSRPTYTSQASIIFTSNAFESFRDPDSAASYTTSLIQSYSNYLQSASVLDPIASKVGGTVSASSLQQSIQLSPSPMLLTIEFENGDRDTADTVVKELVATVRSAVGTVSPTADKTPVLQIVKSSVLTDAVPGTDRSASRSGAIGLLIGIVIALVYLFLRAILDTRVRDVEDVMALCDASVLGALPDPISSDDEASVLAHNLRFTAPRDGVRSVLLASTVPGEASGSAALHAADSLAASGTRTLLVDADLRGREVTELSGAGAAAGLSDVLAGRAELDDAVTAREGRADLLTAGSAVGNPAELLSGAALADALASLGSRYDTIILAGAPVLSGSDSLLISAAVAASVPVIGIGKVKRSDLAQHIELLGMSEAKLGGVVLTGVRRVSAKNPYSPLATAASR